MLVFKEGQDYMDTKGRVYTVLSLVDRDTIEATDKETGDTVTFLYYLSSKSYQVPGEPSSKLVCRAPEGDRLDLLVGALTEIVADRDPSLLSQLLGLSVDRCHQICYLVRCDK